MITGRQIFLRAMELEDIDWLYDLENNPENWAVSNTLAPFSRHTLEQYILSCANQDIFTLKQIRFVIVETTSGNAIGCVDLYDFEPNHLRAGVGILLHSDYRGKGHASECLELLKQYAFKTLKLKQLHCSIAPSNEASLRLFTQAGFIQCGHFKAWRQINRNQWEDELFFQYIVEN
ncbi:MAG: GNAT family N-acetyltransferase [Bacteroidales bacterium]|nr:GNAT family N-acetyltransferase [Bacteroidales bacterium]